MKKRKAIDWDLADSLLDWVASGGAVRTWCQKAGRPCTTTVYAWRTYDEEFAAAFRRARYCGADNKMEEALEVARTPLTGEVTTTESGDGKTKETVRREDMLGHRKLLVETLMKQAACYDPENFGTRNYHEHTGKLSLEQLVCKSFEDETAAKRPAEEPPKAEQ